MIIHKQLSERQEAMRQRVAKSRAKTRAVQKQATHLTGEARKARRLRDTFKATLFDLQQQRRRLYKAIDHVRRDTRRALVKAAKYAEACDRERQRIELAREMAASL